VARDLDEHPDKVQVTLIDRRTVMLNTLGILRSSVNPEWVDKVIVPRNNLLTNGRVINENVSRVEEDRVIFEGGKEIEFDVVVCATGCRNWIEPDESKLTVQELRNHFETTRRDIESAESIAIVGGGAVGVEFAGEIKSRYPGKTVSVIHSSERLINARFQTLSSRNCRASSSLWASTTT
jgi:NADH dehydrogenase FAD-containing subunit